jgi:hypothetical protein
MTFLLSCSSQAFEALDIYGSCKLMKNIFAFLILIDWKGQTKEAPGWLQHRVIDIASQHTASSLVMLGHEAQPPPPLI